VSPEHLRVQAAAEHFREAVRRHNAEDALFAELAEARRDAWRVTALITASVVFAQAVMSIELVLELFGWRP
jgi:hypothetical protein